LFFLRGARLSREAIVAGAIHWRLHLQVLISTCTLFTLLGWLLRPLTFKLITAGLYIGVLFLSMLPPQSSRP
jgi:solute carrier family 10 (sodium/bile acid cotransporter), member 7